MAKIEVDREQLAEFCRRHRIRKLAFFGCVLRDDFGPESDVDVLVEFEPEVRVGLFDIAGMEIVLGEMIGRRIDLRTSRDLSRYFRDDVVRTALPLYVAA